MKHIFISSLDSLEYSPDNTTYDFTVTLPEPIIGRYKVALTEISYPTHFEDLYIFCDIVEQSYLQDKSLPLLRIVTGMGELNHLYYFNVTRQVIQRLRVYILDKNLEKPFEDCGPIRMTLVFETI